MQRCIEARVGILRAVPSLCLFLVAALAHTHTLEREFVARHRSHGAVIFFVHPVGTRSTAPVYGIL